MAEPLKKMYNAAFIEALTAAVAGVYPAFDGRAFAVSVFDDEWEDRELKDRMRHITVSLRALLPGDYREALTILRDASPAMDEHGYSYETMIFPDFVEVFGLDDWEASLPALEQFTQQSSGEFAVRPFILQDTPRMMAQMRAWAAHENHHVRRLSSEGCRPRLPWAMALPDFKRDPTPILPVLEALKHDESEYVRRSVANNFNDIAKDNPQVVLDTLAAWSTTDTSEMRWLVSHALRTLVKAGDATALGILGFGEVSVAIRDFTVQPETVTMGDEVAFTFEVVSTGDGEQALMIDYVMHFVRANDKVGKKVFKLTKKTLKAGETLAVSKRHSFKPISTRRYYPGRHAVEIQVNGAVVARQEFELV